MKNIKIIEQIKSFEKEIKWLEEETAPLRSQIAVMQEHKEKYQWYFDRLDAIEKYKKEINNLVDEENLT